MNSIVIKQAAYHGGDTKLFRAYAPDPAGRIGRRDEPLGVSASTTGNTIFGVQRCAAKAFIKFTEPKADVDEIETRIAIKEITDGVWEATLQGNNAELSSASDASGSAIG